MSDPDLDLSDTADPGPLGDEPPATGRHLGQSKHWYRVALLFTIILVVFVLIALPLAIGSMFGTLFGTTENAYYDLKTGQPLTVDEVEGSQQDRTYLNLGLADLDMDSLSLSLVASGHRQCRGECPELDLLLLSLDPSPVRRGMAPSALLHIDTAIDVFTQEVELPIDGNPSLYPFDGYDIQLAIAGYSVNAAGTPTALTRANFDDNLEISVQDQITELVMLPPIGITLPQVVDNNDLLEALAGQRLELARPVYLQVLSVLLVLLIGISGLMALFTRSIGDLVLGIGGLIIGVWGIRSVMVPQPLPTLSVVDLSLSGVILLLLVGLAIRAAIHFHNRSELDLLRRFRRK